VEISTEFKRDSIHHTFVDPPPASNGNQQNFEWDIDQGKDRRGQWIAYASTQTEISFISWKRLASWEITTNDEMKDGTLANKKQKSCMAPTLIHSPLL
jgi:hypothetical protein